MPYLRYALFHYVCSDNKIYNLGVISSPLNLDDICDVNGPSIKSVPVHYKDDIITSAYVSNFEEIIEKYTPAFWMHGHLHNSSDYKVGDCRVICNPKGYPGELNPNFNPVFTFEV